MTSVKVIAIEFQLKNVEEIPKYHLYFVLAVSCQR